MTSFTMTGVSARKTFGAVVAASAIIALSACGVDGGKAQAEPNVQTSTASTASATATATPSVAKAGVEAGDVINGLPTKKELANDGKGSYIQTTISPNDPALAYDPAIVEANASSAYSEAEIKEVQKLFATFVAEETIDSTLNNNQSDPAVQDAWWAKHKEEIDAPSQDEVLAQIKSTDPNATFLFVGRFRQNSPDYRLVSGSDKTHVHSRTIKPKAIRAGTLPDGRKVLGVQADVQFELNALLHGKPVLESSNGTLSYSYTKDSSGNWKMTGYHAQYFTAPVAE